MATYPELIAHRLTLPEIRDHLGVDRLAYLSLEGMLRAIRSGIPPDRPCGHCHACFSGEYPLTLPMPESGANGAP
jgi:amidophosphoribosyltransferase